jgi:hypothetical protein
LIGWLVRWLAGWLVGWLVGWFVGWLVKATFASIKRNVVNKRNKKSEKFSKLQN